jgi:uncharacterized protein (DUF885 family)
VKSHILLFVLSASAFAIGPVTPAGRQLDSLARAACRSMWEFHPVDATRYGFHDFDGRLGEYTPARTNSFRAGIRGTLAGVERLDSSALSVDERIDRQLLADNIRMELFWLERMRILENNPYFYASECLYGVYTVLLREFAPLPVRALRAAERMAAVPAFVAQARRNLKNPPRFYAGVEELSNASDFFRQSAADLGESVPELRLRLESAAEGAAAAMDSWRDELTLRMPRFPDSFAMGKASYDYLLRHDKGIDFGPDSLLRLGQRLFAWSDSAGDAVAARRDSAYRRNPPKPPEFCPAPTGYSKRDAIAYRNAEIESMRVWVGQSNTATVPEFVGRLGVVETPAFLRSTIPGIAMEAGAPLDRDQSGFFYMPPLPDTFDSLRRQREFDMKVQRGFRGSAVHEGFPGHFLQLSIANHNPSFVRKLQFNTPLIEGWALYCEQMVIEQGLYPPDSFSDLGWLGGVKFRAARIVADVNLQTGRFSYNDAWRYMVDNCWRDTAFMQAECRRYVMSPGQPSSYAVGKLQIMALRDEYAKKAGAGFTLRDFHDRLLAEGSIPVSLIRRKLVTD